MEEEDIEDFIDKINFLDEEETYLEQLFFDLDFNIKYTEYSYYSYYDDSDDDNNEDNISIK
jgi:hypothetical protein